MGDFLKKAYQDAYSAKDKQKEHHIHVRLGDEIHTIACNGNFIEFSDLSNLLDKIVSDYQHKAVHNV